MSAVRERSTHVWHLDCGETGIRTRDTLLTYTRFPGVPLQPLEHLSEVCCLSFAGAKVGVFPDATKSFLKKMCAQPYFSSSNSTFSDS